ncbi:MAG: hypothetical protein OXH52_08510 [Gammaproteobacteria bacterium]|nr:hypothetical protein [Gammaproteobacteria bacterium]
MRVRAWSRACAVAIIVFCVAAPVPSEAGTIDVPMRRGQATTPAAAPDSTWGEIASAAATVMGEIEVLRVELGVGDEPPEAELQLDRLPAHVYVKSLEVMAKVGAVQRRFGVPTGSSREIPLTEPSAVDVLASVTEIFDGIRAIKTQMIIETEVDQAVVSGFPTLAGVYKNLADSSYLLDGLIGYPLNSGDVYGNTSAIVEELSLIGTKLQVVLDTESPAVDAPKRTIDIAQQLLRAIYKTVSLQGRLGMEASMVPTLTMVRVTPTETYDLAGLLWTEVARIKWHLGVNVPVVLDQPPTRNDRADLFAQTLLIIRNLDQLTAGAGN